MRRAFDWAILVFVVAVAVLMLVVAFTSHTHPDAGLSVGPEDAQPCLRGTPRSTPQKAPARLEGRRHE